jgi:hypothetical protein
MSKYETTIELENGEEVDVEVDFDFSPAEKMTHDYPGCDADVEINQVVTVDGKEIEITKEDEEFIKEQIFDWIDKYDNERWDY